MNIKEIESLADDMVEVCINRYGAKPTVLIRGQNELLWSYFVRMLKDTVNSTVDTGWSKQSDLQREMRDLTSQDIMEAVESLKERREALSADDIGGVG